MKTWEQQISEELQALEDCCVRFDTEQSIDSTGKATAKNNVGFTPATAENISGDDYKIVIAY